MKSILIYIHSYFPFEDSNTNVVLPIINKLKDSYNVEILSCNNDNKQPWKEKIDGITISRFKNYKRFKGLIVRINQLDFNIKTRHFTTKILYKIVKPFVNILYKVLLRTDQITLRKLIKSNRFSVIITVTSPIRPQYSALKLADERLFERYNMSWISYFTDPWAAYIGNKYRSETLFNYEARVYNQCNKVVVTPEIYKDNQSNPLSKFLNKTVALPLANLKENKSQETFGGYISGKINCLYTGSLQDCSVRNPEYFFKIIQKCGDGFVFHMIVNRWTSETLKLREKYLKNNKNVIWYDRVSLKESLTAMKSSDILINLGNRSTNQLPGKVSDYIGSCRPIVNIYPYENDTSREYLKNYPYKLNLKENDNLIEQQALLFSDFCKKNHNILIDFSEIHTKYEGYTSEYIAESFSNIVHLEIDRQE